MNEERTFVGYGYGVFSTDDGRRQNYCNVFLLESFTGEQSADYHYGGVKAVKYGCVSPEVFKDIEFGSQVDVYYNSKGKVQFMQVVPGKAKAAAAK